MSSLKIKNIAFYHFFQPAFDLYKAKITLKTRMIELSIKGSILLAEEGINSSLAGPIEAMDQFIEFLLQTIGVSNPILKITYSENIPFKRSLVKVKPFIVHHPGVTPVDLSKDSAPYLSPEELNAWIEEGKEMVLLDTRNDYEYEAGKFKNCVKIEETTKLTVSVEESDTA